MFNNAISINGSGIGGGMMEDLEDTRYLYHSTHKRNLDSILKNGLRNPVWLDTDIQSTIDYVKFNHHYADKDIITFRVNIHNLDATKLNQPRNSMGMLIGDYYYKDNILPDKLELVR